MCLYRCLYNYSHANKARCCCNCRPKVHITLIKMSGGEKKKAKRKTYERGDRKFGCGRERPMMCLSRAVEVVLTF